MQADLRGRLTTEIEVKSCGDQFYKLWTRSLGLFSKIFPSEIRSCKVQEGEFGKNGSVILWNYVHDGQASVAKEVLENVDLEQRKITFRVIEGDLLNIYKSFSIHLQVTPKGDNVCLVRWSCEYEKLSEDLPEPTSLVDLMVKMTKDGLEGKTDCGYEARSSGDLFHELFAKTPHHISKIASAHIQGCELHEGEFRKNDSIIFWNYNNNGKACVSKMVVDNLDEVNKTITYKEIEGDLLKSYKTFSVHLHVKTKDGNTSLINWTLEYEKLHEDVPHPTTLLEVAINVSKNIEDHQLKA